jgi:CrcB protein
VREAFLIFLGGGAGSVLRYYLGKWVQQWHTTSFPIGTLTVNIIACLVLGFVIGLADHKQLISPGARLFWTVGFCGGFSTFSTFSNETLYLMQGGFTLSTVLYVGLSLVLCLVAVYTGLHLAHLIKP